MTRHLIIVCHGYQRDGSFDPGATGYIKKGEHRYVKEDLVPAMKRHLPDDAEVVFYDDRKVSNYGNLPELVRQYDPDEVTEIHFDAHVLRSSARGGHVIIHSAYAPDKVDLALRDAIAKMVGVRYSHKGHKGISGRNNLYNVNDARRIGVAYRLLELGFGTNQTDAHIMTAQVDDYARELVKALFGGAASKPSAPAKEPAASKPKPKPSGKQYTSVVDYMNDHKMDSSFSNRARLAKSHGIRNYRGTKSQNIKLLAKLQSGAKPASKPKKKSTAVIAQEVIDGKWKTGADRRKALEAAGYSYNKIQRAVNRKLRAGKKSAPKRRSVDQMAREIIDNPNAPDGHAARREWLGVNNATYQKVRRRVNQLM